MEILLLELFLDFLDVGVEFLGAALFFGAFSFGTLFSSAAASRTFTSVVVRTSPKVWCFKRRDGLLGPAVEDFAVARAKISTISTAVGRRTSGSSWIFFGKDKSIKVSSKISTGWGLSNTCGCEILTICDGGLATNGGWINSESPPPISEFAFASKCLLNRFRASASNQDSLFLSLLKGN